MNLIGLVRKLMAEIKVLIARTGMESTRATIRMTKKAADAGADAAHRQPH